MSKKKKKKETVWTNLQINQLGGIPTSVFDLHDQNKASSPR